MFLYITHAYFFVRNCVNFLLIFNSYYEIIVKLLSYCEKDIITKIIKIHSYIFICLLPDYLDYLPVIYILNMNLNASS